MTPDRVAKLFHDMRDAEEGVNNFVMEVLLSQMLGRSLEAAIPLMERAHGLMAAQPGKRFLMPGGETARTAMAIECPEGPHGGIWRKAFLFEGAGPPVVTVLEVSGEPDPAIDGIVDRMLAEKGHATPLRKHEPGPCRSVKVYAPRTGAEIPAILMDSSRDKWRSDMALEARATMEPYDAREEWRDFHRNVASGRGLDIWVGYFRDLRALLGELGLSEAMAASSDEVAARNWTKPGKDNEDARDYAAAHEFGSQIALEDGYLPGANCVAALATLDRLAAEAAMARMQPKMLRLHEMLPQLVDERNSFDCNDGRNEVIHTGGDREFRLEMGDQSNRYDVICGPVRVQVLGERTDKGLRGRGKPCLDLRFERGPDGGWSMTGEIGQSKDAIRGWNSFKSGIMTIACCAEEELKDQARHEVSGPTA